MEFFFKIVEIVKKLLNDEKILRMSSTLFLTSLFAFAGVNILSHYAIILSMMNIIKEILIWTMIFTSSFTVASLIVNYFERVLKNRQSKIAEQKAEQEAQKKAKELDEKINVLLSSLSEAENSILKLITEKGNCGVLVPENDTVVLTLLHKGILEKISDKGEWIDWNGAYDNRAYCVPVIIAQKFQKTVSNKLHKRAR